MGYTIVIIRSPQNLIPIIKAPTLVLQIRVPFRVLFFIRVPYYIGDLERGPNLENSPFVAWGDEWWGGWLARAYGFLGLGFRGLGLAGFRVQNLL